MKFELYMAARYLRAKRRQAVIGIITGISIAGVSAGVAALIIALAINNGFRQDLQTRLLGATSHVNLVRIQDDGIHDWEPLLARLAKTPHVIAAAPAIYEQVLISRGARAQGAQVKGVLPRYENQVSDLLKTVKAESLDSLDAPPRNLPPPQASDNPSPADRVSAMPPIVLGKDMADQLGVRVGSVVTIISPQGELTPFGIVPKYVRYRVDGVFNSGFYEYDIGWAFTGLSNAQSLFGLGNVVSVLEFKLDDIYRAEEIGQILQKEAGPGFMATNWMDQNREIFRALRLERIVTFITIGLIVFVAALNILISLIMMVMEKTRDIAVLRSMGARKRQVRNIFISQGLLIGVIGTGIGLIVGYAAAWAGGHYHFLSLAPEVYSIDYVPFAPRLTDGIVVGVVSLLISFVATIYPSFTASRIYPAEALRYE